MSKAHRLTLIAGPTASGKSRLALDMARETGAVIINADSQQLYADLRVLTARPSIEDEQQADHRLYGHVDAAEAWSVGQWSRAVLDLLNELGDQPAILVGGTGLYFNALTKGLADIPTVPDVIRDKVANTYDEAGEQAFRQELRSLDPETEARIFPSDRQRLIRALSVYRATGRTLTDYRTETQPLLSPGTWQGLVLEPERDQLYANCDRRVDIMLNTGAIEEVEALMQRDLPSSLPAMKAVGLRELIAWHNGTMSKTKAVEAMKQATRNYAKRQLTWFRNQQADWPRHI